ncbi:MAG: 2-methylcitrate synthase, partial [Dehalococcoidia bacterium]|nr:2-methylcitrate synthase [Dehalococcoidia bacterium]
MTETATPAAAGLAGVIAGETAICTVGKAGLDLTYRGYNVKDLAASSTFEEVAYLLIYGELPTATQLAAYTDRLHRLRHIPVPVKTVLELIPPSADPMDVLRTGASMLGVEEPETRYADEREAADRLLAVSPAMLLYWWHYSSTGLRPDSDTNEPSLAGHFLHLLLGKSPSPLLQKIIDVSLILYAEHEFNASTFTARTIISTRSDYHSAIVGAIGALKGPLHGGANEAAMALLQQFSTPDEAERGLLAMLARKELIMGFG